MKKQSIKKIISLLLVLNFLFFNFGAPLNAQEQPIQEENIIKESASSPFQAQEISGETASTAAPADSEDFILLIDLSAVQNKTNSTSSDLADEILISRLAQENASSTPAVSSTTPSQAESANNQITGYNSENSAQTNESNETNIANQNSALAINYSQIKAETGSNLTDYNTGSGVITTRDANGKGEIINSLNFNNTIIYPGEEANAQARNSQTGALSNNESSVNLNEKLTVKNINSANTLNRLEAFVNSGNNSASFNTNHGIILSGNANLGANFFTIANTNITGNQKFYADWQNIYGNFAGNVDLGRETAVSSRLSSLILQAANKQTGFNSRNQAAIIVNDELVIRNQNEGKLNNEISAQVISGRNKSNANTGTGSVVSGDIRSAINAVNFLNTNITASNFWLKSFNVFGNWQGNLILPKLKAAQTSTSSSEVLDANNQTGYESTNETSQTASTSVAIENFNDAKIENKINIKTGTGENKTSYNANSGVVKFGYAQAETNELNAANLNITGKPWWMIVINKFGSWQGTTIGSPLDMETKSSANTSIFSSAQSGIEAINSSTGAESNNGAGVRINHSTDLQNSNESDISNDIKLEAISGENEVQYNTGHGYVETGNIKAATNVINFANSNITAADCLIAVVNVFGDWTGNLIFGNEDENQAAFNGQSNYDNNSSSSTAGASSQNNASSDNSNQTDIQNNNNSQTINNTGASSSSGQNSASYNTGSGIVTTGQSDTSSSIGNQSNANQTAIGQTGNNSSSTPSNSITGQDSQNNASSAQTDQTDISNDNDSDTQNNLYVEKITGLNSSDYNTGAGVVDTDWASTFLRLYNENNENVLTLGDLRNDLSIPGENEENQNQNNESATPSPTPAPSQSPEQSGNPSPSNNLSSGQSSNSSSYDSSRYSGESGTGSSGASASPLNFIKGDLNQNGKVDDYDFSILISNWGKRFTNKSADINKDNKVDDYDFSLLIANWNISK